MSSSEKSSIVSMKKLAPLEPTDFYNVRNLTRFGPASVPGYAMVPMKGKPRMQDGWVQPGPGDYCPESYDRMGQRGLKFSLGERLDDAMDDRANLPGPNEYQHVCVTPDCRDKQAGKTIATRLHERTPSFQFPFQDPAPLDAYKPRAPTYRMANPNVARLPPGYYPSTPGPSDYLPRSSGGPAFSFGRKYSDKVSTMRTNCEYQMI